jgi:uncharacterized sodium:solute symporter family permease YidK
MKKARTLLELFSYPGFIAKNQLEGKFGDPKVRIIQLERKKKRLPAPSAALILAAIMIVKFVPYVIAIQRDIKFIFVMRDDEHTVINVVLFAWRL